MHIARPDFLSILQELKCTFCRNFTKWLLPQECFGDQCRVVSNVKSSNQQLSNSYDISVLQIWVNQTVSRFYQLDAARCLTHCGAAPVDSSAQSWQGIKRFYDTVSVRGVTSTGEFVEGGDAEAWQVCCARLLALLHALTAGFPAGPDSGTRIANQRPERVDCMSGNTCLV